MTNKIILTREMAGKLSKTASRLDNIEINISELKAGDAAIYRPTPIHKGWPIAITRTTKTLIICQDEQYERKFMKKNGNCYGGPGRIHLDIKDFASENDITIENHSD